MTSETGAGAAVLDAFNPNANYLVYSLVEQPDGKILVGGIFTWLDGQPRGYLARVNSDGSLDLRFNPGADRSVFCLGLEKDGRALAAGLLTSLASQARNHLGRLNPDGSLDDGFNPFTGDFAVSIDPAIEQLAFHADGRIVAGGLFGRLTGQSARHLIFRLDPDGTVDTHFTPAPGVLPFPVAVQPDGKLLVTGNFSEKANGTTQIGRLNLDGTLDPNFSATATAVSDPRISCLVVQPDGKILVGGYFTNLCGSRRLNLGRLTPDGALDASFNPVVGDGSLNYGSVSSLALQANGKLLVGGSFSLLSGQSRTNVGRLNPDGTLDVSFDAGPSQAPPPFAPSIIGLSLQANGQLLVGGNFTNFAGAPRNYLARLNNNEPATQSLSYTNERITWLRGGSSPEVWRPTFAYSTNGADWIDLGPGTRVEGGWQLDRVFLPGHYTLRAIGELTSGANNGSCGFVESAIGAPVTSVGPFSQTNFLGTWASFDLHAIGTAPLSYQWRQNGKELAGETNNVLVFDPVRESNAGAFTVVVTNTSGSVTSTVAILTTLLPPFILPNGAGFGFRQEHFGFNVSGPPGRMVVVESSIDLKEWTQLTNLVFDFGPTYFGSPYAVTNPLGFRAPNRFYRLRARQY